jgi:hypothetical protein
MPFNTQLVAEITFNSEDLWIVHLKTFALVEQLHVQLHLQIVIAIRRMKSKKSMRVSVVY